MSENVKDGSIAYILNKPYDFLLYQFSTAMGETIFRAMLNAVFGGLTVWWLVGAPNHPEGFLIALPAILGAWVLHFCINAMIGLSAFVVEDVSAFTWIYQKLAFIFGGMLIPLDFYPHGYRPRKIPAFSTQFGRAFIDSTQSYLCWYFLDRLGTCHDFCLLLLLSAGGLYRPDTSNGG
jgi:hypothetical protein